MPQIDFGHIPRGHFDWAISNIWRVCDCCVSLNTNLPSSRATDIASQGGAAVDGDPRTRRRLRRPVGCQWVKGWPSSISIFTLISIFRQLIGSAAANLLKCDRTVNKHKYTYIYRYTVYTYLSISKFCFIFGRCWQSAHWAHSANFLCTT